MVDFRDPAEIAKTYLTVVKFWHMVDGIYIWEYFITLDLEWEVIRGRRPHGWTFWIYSLTRLATLTAVIINLIILNTAVIINCQITILLHMIPSYLALSSATVLLVLRIIAIWNKNRAVMAITMCAWGISGACIIQAVVRIRAERDIPDAACIPLNFQVTEMTNIASFVTDFVLLVMMIVGLIRLGCHREGSLAMGRFLWRQGILWVLIALIAGIIPVVVHYLNLNDPLSEMFQFPYQITVVIAATRMYRALQDFSSPILHRHTYESPQSGNAMITIKGTSSTSPMPLGRIRVDVHTSQETCKDGLIRSTEKQVKDDLDYPRGLV